MKIALIALVGMLSLSAQEPVKEDVKPPVISDALQKEFWAALAEHHSVSADYERANGVASLKKEQLNETAALVNKKRAAIAAACGEKFELDDEQFRKGIATCIEKKPPPAPPPGK